MNLKFFSLLFFVGFLFNACANPPVQEVKSNEKSQTPQVIACPMIYMPVCGDDGKTYGNECMANGAGIQIASKGECSESSDKAPKQKPCTREYNPVCGEKDGEFILYPNQCMFENARANPAIFSNCNQP